MQIKLKVDVLEQIQKENKWGDTELANRLGISRSRLWRAKLPETHEKYCAPGESFIASVLNTFPDKSFDDFFFLDKLCS